MPCTRWAAVILVGLSIVVLAWYDPGRPGLVERAFVDYVACPVCMAPVMAGGVSGAGAILLYVRGRSGSGGRTRSR